MDNRGIDQDPGWINRQLRELRQAIEALRSERRAAATTVSSGDLTVSGGGSVIVKDGGNLIAEFTGRVIAKREDGLDAAWFGTLEYSPGQFWTGIMLAGAVTGEPLFRATTDPAFGQWVESVSSVIDLRHPSNGARVKIDSDGLRLATSLTTSASPNVYNDSVTNLVMRSTSSRRYKQDIADHEIDPTAVLKMRVRTWRDRSEVDRDADTTQRYIGFIAEELHDLGLTEFVSYDKQGRPDAVAYDRIPVALLIALRWLTKQVKDERARTDALEAKVATQQQQIDALTARLDALSGPTTPTTTTRST